MYVLHGITCRINERWPALVEPVRGLRSLQMHRTQFENHKIKSVIASPPIIIFVLAFSEFQAIACGQHTS